MNTIVSIPADEEGNKLFIKHFHTLNNKMFCSYRSTYNDMPFQETELFSVDNNQNVAILDGTGAVMWRFNKRFLNLFKII